MISHIHSVVSDLFIYPSLYILAKIYPFTALPCISQYAAVSHSELSILLSCTSPHTYIHKYMRVPFIYLPIAPPIKYASPFLYMNSCARREGISFPFRHLWDWQVCTLYTTAMSIVKLLYASYRPQSKQSAKLFFSPVVGIGTPLTPHPRASVPPLPPFLGGGAHSLAREGLRESQCRRKTYTVILFINMYFVI